MAIKIKRNSYGDCIYSEDDVLNLLYENPDLDISKLYIENTEIYNETLKKLGIDLPQLSQLPVHPETVSDFDKKLQNNWYMPEYYKSFDVLDYLIKKCQNKEEEQRVKEEYALFEKKNFLSVLKFLIYFVETLRKNNVVWGVGRGSSVSSFCLFLIGVHKINPLLYDLDHREFLR